MIEARSWVDGGLAATVYLEANTRTTVPMKPGSYRLRIASGTEWQGSDALFGPATQVGLPTRLVHLIHGSGRTLVVAILPAPTGNAGIADMRTERRLRRRMRGGDDPPGELGPNCSPESCAHS